MGTGGAVDPEAFFRRQDAAPAAELPDAAPLHAQQCAASVGGTSNLDRWRKVEADGKAKLAATLAAGRLKQVIALKLASVWAQLQPPPVEEAEAADITVMARLDPADAANLVARNLDLAHAL